MQTKLASKFSGPSIVSLLEPQVLQPIQEIIPETTQHFDPWKLMFTSYHEAIEWRESLNEQQIKYLHGVERSIMRMVPGEIKDLTNVKEDVKEHFYRCLSYIIIGLNLYGEISSSSDFTKIKRNE